MGGIYQQFLSGLRRGGVSKTSHFQLAIPLLPGLSTTFGGHDRAMALRCEAAELPGRQLVSNDSKVYGPTYKTPYESSYQETTLTFLETRELFIRQFFESWMDSIFESRTNLLNYPSYYRTDVQLVQYDMFSTKDIATSNGGFGTDATLDVIAIWNLVQAFPTAVNQMPLAWSEDGFHRVSVTMAFEYYRISQPTKPVEPISTSASPKPPVAATGPDILGKAAKALRGINPF
jgi:hypothetical protein